MSGNAQAADTSFDPQEFHSAAPLARIRTISQSFDATASAHADLPTPPATTVQAAPEISDEQPHLAGSEPPYNNNSGDTNIQVANVNTNNNAENKDNNVDDNNARGGSGREGPTVTGRRPSPLRSGAGVAALLNGGDDAASDRDEEDNGHNSDNGPAAAAAAPTYAVAIEDQAAAAAALTEMDIAAAARLPLPPGGRTSERGGPSRYRGVVWHKSNSKWEARIYESGKQRFLGYFTNEDAAAIAYDEQALRLHGAAAKLNFPERWATVRLPPPSMAHHIAGSRARGPGRPTRKPAGSASAHRNPRRSPGGPGGGGGGGNPRAQPVKGSSRFRGVSWNSNCSKWRAQVWKGSDVHHLGYFEREEDAARAYDEAVLRIRGPDAQTNYPRAEYGSVMTEAHPRLDRLKVVQPQQHQQYMRSAVPSVHQGSYGDAHAERGAYMYEPQGNDLPTAPATHAAAAGGFEAGASSGMLGVSWSDNRRGWVAEIWDGRKYVLLGVFSSEDEAARAYDLACLEQHGAEALTNFPLKAYEMELAALALKDLAADSEGACFGGGYGGPETASVDTQHPASHDGSAAASAGIASGVEFGDEAANHARSDLDGSDHRYNMHRHDQHHNLLVSHQPHLTGAAATAAAAAAAALGGLNPVAIGKTIGGLMTGAGSGASVIRSQPFAGYAPGALPVTAGLGFQDQRPTLGHNASAAALARRTTTAPLGDHQHLSGFFQSALQQQQQQQQQQDGNAGVSQQDHHAQQQHSEASMQAVAKRLHEVLLHQAQQHVQQQAQQERMQMQLQAVIEQGPAAQRALLTLLRSLKARQQQPLPQQQQRPVTPASTHTASQAPLAVGSVRDNPAAGPASAAAGATGSVPSAAALWLQQPSVLQAILANAAQQHQQQQQQQQHPPAVSTQPLLNASLFQQQLQSLVQSGNTHAVSAMLKRSHDVMMGPKYLGANGHVAMPPTSWGGATTSGSLEKKARTGEYGGGDSAAVNGHV